MIVARYEAVEWRKAIWPIRAAGRAASDRRGGES
jgi:hypothetical protein